MSPRAESNSTTGFVDAAVDVLKQRTQDGSPSSGDSSSFRSIEEIDRSILRLCRRMNADNYQLLVLIREFDDRHGWRKAGFESCSRWLHWRCDLSYSAAREKVRVAHALALLPVMSSAFSTGSLSYSKVRALTRIATAETEAGLIEMARDMSATHVDEHCRQRQYARAKSRESAADAHSRRSLRSHRDDARGVVTISIELPMAEGLLFERAIDKACVDGDGSKRAPDDTTPWSALQADAAVAMARAYLADSAPASTRPAMSTADHYQVMIHVDHAALTGKAADGASLSSDSGARSDLPIDIVKRLCCDGSIVPVVENEEGEPLRVGRRQRVVGTAIRRALWARDRGCIFPGCSHKRFVDAHHVRHWAEGGETSVRNMILLCSSHHQLVHEGGYQVHYDPRGRRVFVRPDGQVMTRSGYGGDGSLDGAENDPRESFAGESRVGEPRPVYRVTRRSIGAQVQRRHAVVRKQVGCRS